MRNAPAIRCAPSAESGPGLQTGHCLCAAGLLFLLCLPAAGISEDWRPRSWGGRLAVGIEQRTAASEEASDPDLGTGDGRFWYAEVEDARLSLQLWSQWKTRLAGRPMRIEASYERMEWARSPILGQDLFELELRQGVSKRSLFELALAYTPQIYSRHRIDKDALPGEPQFRPQARRELGAEIGWTHAWRSDFASRLFLDLTLRDESRWFEERDCRRTGAGASCEFPVGGIDLVPCYEYRVNRSRNEPDLGSDLSYREHLAELRLRHSGAALPGGPYRVELATRWKFRAYTTDDPEDDWRYGRREQIYSMTARVSRPMGWLVPFVSLETYGRAAKTAVEEAFDEDDDADRTFFLLGVEWERDLSP